MELLRCQSQGCGGHGVAVVEVTAGQNDGTAVLAGLLRGQGGQQRVIDGGDHRVQMQAVEVGAIPVGVDAVLFRKRRIDAAVKGCAVGEGAAGQHLAVGDEGQGKGGHAAGHTLRRGEGVEAHRLRAAREALAVDARQCVGDEIVIGERTGVRAGDGALVLLAAGDVHQRPAAGNGAGAAVGSLRHTGTHDTAHVFFAAEGTLGIAAADGGSGETGDAAHAAAAVTFHAAVALTGDDEAEVHAPGDAAGVAALGGDGTGVGALLHYGAVLVLPAVFSVQIGTDVILWVQLVLDGDGAGNAAGVDIAADRTAVGTGRGLAQRDLVDVPLRAVRNDGGGVAGGGDGGQHGVGYLIELAVDVPQVVRHGVHRAGGAVVQVVQAAAEARDGGQGVLRVGEGVLQVVVHVFEPVGHAACAVLGVIGGLIGQGLQLVQLAVQLRQIGGRGVHLDIGLDLARHAAHVLASGDGAIVPAAQELAAAAAHHAAGVIADVLVAHGTVVHTIGQRTGAVSGDAAGISGGGAGVGLPQLGQVRRQRQIQILQIQTGIGALHVDAGAVGAVGQQALVIACDAAGHAVADDRAAGLTGQDTAGGAGVTGDAAYVYLTGHRAGEAALFDGTVVLAGDAAHASAVTGGGDGAHHMEAANGAARLYHAEQAGGGQTVRYADIMDGVTLPVKAAAEGGDGQEGRVRQRQVAVQHHVFIAGPGVQRAAGGQIPQLRFRGDVDGIAGSVGLRHGQAGQQHQGCQQSRGQMPYVNLLPHRRVPPLPPLRRAWSGLHRPPPWRGSCHGPCR